MTLTFSLAIPWTQTWISNELIYIQLNLITLLMLWRPLTHPEQAPPHTPPTLYQHQAVHWNHKTCLILAGGPYRLQCSLDHIVWWCWVDWIMYNFSVLCPDFVMIFPEGYWMLHDMDTALLFAKWMPWSHSSRRIEEGSTSRKHETWWNIWWTYRSQHHTNTWGFIIWEWFWGRLIWKSGQ